MNSIVILLVAAIWASVSCSRQNMICHPTESVCAEGPFQEQTQGRPGKMGAKGSKGDAGLPGIKGQAGTVDREALRIMVNREVESATKELRTQLGKLKIELERSNAYMASLEEDIGAEGCRLRYNGMCYRALVHTAYDVPLSKALQFCQKYGMEPAEITTEHQYLKLSECIRAEIPSGRTFADIFTGMTYDPQNGILRLSDGTRGPFIKWYPGNPSSGSGRSPMGIVVRKDAENPIHGMYNVGSSSQLHGIVCQKRC